MWNAMACAVMVLMALMIWPDSARSGRLTGVPSDVAGEGGAAVSLPLLIGLLSVSLRSGMSVTRSLEGVGEAVGGALGGGLCAVADALHRGSSWKDAWNAADFGDYAETSAILRGVLEPSWTRGVSPIGPSDDGFGAVDGRRANRDRAGVGVSVGETAAAHGIVHAAGVRVSRHTPLGDGVRGMNLVATPPDGR